VEDEPMMADSLVRALRDPFDVLPVFDTVGGVLGLAEALTPDVIVLDVWLRDRENAFLRLPELRQRFPGAGILLHTGHPEAAPVAEALAAGVLGYIVKCDLGSVTLLRTAIREVAAGRVWLSATPEEELARRGGGIGAIAVEPITDPPLRRVPPDHPERDRLEALRRALLRAPERLKMAVRVRRGLSYSEIAEELGCTTDNVETAMKRLFGPIRLRNREALAVLMVVLLG
jgi:DNA-binding NarL/FixJ family response regulator